MEDRQNIDFNIDEFTLIVISRVIAKHASLINPKDTSWKNLYAGININDDRQCLRAILQTIDYINPTYLSAIKEMVKHDAVMLDAEAKEAGDTEGDES